MKTKILILLIVGIFGYTVCFAESNCSSPCTEKGPVDYGLSDMTFIAGDKAFMKIYDQIDYEDRDFWNDINVLREKTSIREIDVLINSYGGSAFVGFALFDMINMAEKRGFKFRAHGAGMIASAAVMVFLAFDDRTCSPSTIFMVHEASSETTGGTSSQVRAQTALFDILRDQYFDVLIAETSVKDRGQWEDWERKTEWFTSKQALERGLIRGIEE